MNTHQKATRAGPNWISLSDAMARLAERFGGADKAEAELDKRIRWGEVAVRAGFIRRSEMRWLSQRQRWTCDSVKEYRNERVPAKDWPHIQVCWAEDRGSFSVDPGYRSARTDVEIQDIHISLDDLSRMWPPTVVHEMATPTTYTTGLPGRPRSTHLIDPEFDRRKKAGEIEGSRMAEARYLAGWLKDNHPNAAPATVKTIFNQLPPGIWGRGGTRN